MKLSKPLWYVAVGVFLILDRFLKWLSLHTWSENNMLGRWLGWHPFLNPGVAFGIPVPLPIMIILCLAIIVCLVWWRVARYGLKNWVEQLGMVAVILGASSNVYDRVTLHATVDYFQILTGVFNVADFMIIAGFVLIFINNRKHDNAA